MTDEMKQSSRGTEWIIAPASHACRRSPLTSSHSRSARQSSPGASANGADSGRNESCPLHTLHGMPAVFAAVCSSRSVMSRPST